MKSTKGPKSTRTLLLAALIAAAAAGPLRAGSYGTELPFAAGTGARASGLGLAVTSLPGTPTSQYFNPALLSTQQRKAFEFYRTTLFDSDTQFHSAAYVHPSLDWGTLGVTVMRLDVGGIEQRDETNTLLSTDLQNSQTRVLLGYAMDVLPSVSAGANLKIDHHSFGDASGSAIGLDIGFLATRELSRVSWLDHARGSIVAENIVEPSVKLDADRVADPRQMTFGVSVDGHRGDVDYATTIDLVSPRYSPFQTRIGQEVGYRHMVWARAGWDGDTPTFGVGGAYRTVSLDYAYRDEDLGSNHRISLSVSFGPTLDEVEMERRTRVDRELQERVQATVSEFERTQLESVLSEADRLYGDGDYAAARTRYGVALMLDAGNARASERTTACDRELALALAAAALHDNDPASALQHFRRAAEVDSTDARAREGVERCEALIADAQDRAQVIDKLVARAIESYAKGDYIGARAGFEDAARLEPANKIAHEFIAKCDAGIASSLTALRPQARNQERGGDLAAAVESLERARALAPDDPAIAGELERVRRLGAQEASRREAPKAAPKPPPAPDIDTAVLDRKYNEGMSHFDRGEFAAAAQLWMQVWTVAPAYRDVSTPLVRACLLEGMDKYSAGYYEDAIDVWQRALTVDPENPKVRRYLTKAREEKARLGGGTK